MVQEFFTAVEDPLPGVSIEEALVVGQADPDLLSIAARQTEQSIASARGNETFLKNLREGNILS